MRVDDRRIIDEHDESLAAHVNALIVVPAILRSDYSVADENHVRVFDCDVGQETLSQRNRVLGKFEPDGLSACRKESCRSAAYASERDRLNVATVRVAGRQMQVLELLRDVLNRKLPAARAGQASLVFVRGKDLDVAENSLRRDRAPGSVRRADLRRRYAGVKDPDRKRGNTKGEPLVGGGHCVHERTP